MENSEEQEVKAMRTAFEEAKAKKEAKRRLAENQAILENEQEYEQERWKQIDHEVAQVGGWEAWEELQRQYEESLADVEPCEGPSIEDMVANYVPEPPNVGSLHSFGEAKAIKDGKLDVAKRFAENMAWLADKMLHDQERSKQIEHEVAQAGGWEAWEKQEKQREEMLANPPPYDGPSEEQMLKDAEEWSRTEEAENSAPKPPDETEPGA